MLFVRFLISFKLSVVYVLWTVSFEHQMNAQLFFHWICSSCRGCCFAPVFTLCIITFPFLRAADGQIELSPEMQKEIKTELDRVGRVYGSAPGVNMAEFPTFNFPEPKVDAINL